MKHIKKPHMGEVKKIKDEAILDLKFPFMRMRECTGTVIIKPTHSTARRGVSPAEENTQALHSLIDKHDVERKRNLSMSQQR